MMGYGTIRHIAEEAAETARETGKKPWHPESAEVFATYDNFRVGASIPFLGDYVPEGWVVDEDTEPWFVDTSGFGDPGEPALTLDQLRVALRDHFYTHPSAGYALVEQGQFQGYVQAYLYKGKRHAPDAHLGGVE